MLIRLSSDVRFAPDIPCLLYHGDKTTREGLRKKYFSKSQNSNTFPIVVTSYEIVMNDRKFLSKLQWKFIVIDEGTFVASHLISGHRIKNLNCKLIRELKSYNSANRLLLTGTPLQNNLKELWSLLNFIV
jgi:ATP-dependent DNA helicase